MITLCRAIDKILNTRFYDPNYSVDTLTVYHII